MRAASLGGLLLCLGLSVSAYGRDADTPLSSLGNTYWHVTAAISELNGMSPAVIRIGNHVAHHSFDFAIPCFYSSHPMKEKEGVLQIQVPAHSGSNCTKEEPSVRLLIEQLASKVRKYKVRDDTLSFLDGDDKPLITLTRFIPEGLEYRKWFVTAYFDGKELVPVDRSAKYAPNITFMGMVEPYPFCGGLSGYYSLSGDRLKTYLRPFLINNCFLSEEANKLYEQNLPIAKAIRGVSHVELNGGSVILRDEQGVIRATLSE